VIKCDYYCAPSTDAKADQGRAAMKAVVTIDANQVRNSLETKIGSIQLKNGLFSTKGRIASFGGSTLAVNQSRISTIPYRMN